MPPSRIDRSHPCAQTENGGLAAHGDQSRSDDQSVMITSVMITFVSTRGRALGLRYSLAMDSAIESAICSLGTSTDSTKTSLPLRRPAAPLSAEMPLDCNSTELRVEPQSSASPPVRPC